MQSMVVKSIGIVGCILILIGLGGWLIFLPKIVQKQINEQVYIKNDTNDQVFKTFKSLPIPIHLSVWIFEIDTKNFDGKNMNTMRFKRKGPYVWDELRDKTIVDWSSNYENVTYTEKKTYMFNEKLSCNDCHEYDQITIYNVLHGLPQWLVDALTPKPYNLTLTGRVDELIIKGSQKILGSSLLGYDDTRHITVNTGKSDINQVTQTIAYDDKSKLPFWNGDFCNEIKGTDGQQFKPDLNENDIIYIFEPLLGRVWSLASKLLPNEEIKGLSSLRFSVQDKNYDLLRENKCFCLEKTIDQCKKGLLNLKNVPSSHNVEILASTGYYYFTPKYLEDTGLLQSGIINETEATFENYVTTVDVEPNTGIVLRAHKKLMLNLKVIPKVVPAMNNLTGDYQFVPLVYVEEFGEIDDNNANMLKDKLSMKRLAMGSFISISVIGLLMVIVSIYFYIKSK